MSECIYNLFFIKIHFIYLKVVAVEGEEGKEGEVFWVHSSNGCTDWGWARPKDKADGSIQVSHTDTGSHTLSLPFTAFPGALSGKWSAQDLNQHPLKMSA